MILEKINSNITEAMRNKNAARLTALRAMKVALDKVLKDKGSLSEADEIKALEGIAKRHQDSILAFDKADRLDLVAKEAIEVAVVLEFLPTMATDTELNTAVSQAIEEVGGLSGIGAVMKAAQAKLVGKRVDNSALSMKVKQALSNLPQY